MIKPSSTHFQQISGGTHPRTGTKLIFGHERTFGSLGKYQFSTCPQTLYHLIFAGNVQITVNTTVDKGFTEFNEITDVLS